MSSKKGPFIINLKNYLEISGDKALAITKEAEKVSYKLDTEIIIAPPQPLLTWIAKNTVLKVISQHLDLQKPGASTGFFIPEIVKEAGGIGSIINHSEHQINFEVVKSLIEKMQSLGLLAFVCTKNLSEFRFISSMQPDYIAIEPPELIGTQMSISTEKPTLISESAQFLKGENKKSKLICGAGINKPEDVRIAVELGASGILAASSIVKSNNWYEKIYELASEF